MVSTLGKIIKTMCDHWSINQSLCFSSVVTNDDNTICGQLALEKKWAHYFEGFWKLCVKIFQSMIDIEMDIF